MSPALPYIAMYIALTYGHRAFAIFGHRILNSLPDYLNGSEPSIDVFKRYLKTYFFARN